MWYLVPIAAQIPVIQHCLFLLYHPSTVLLLAPDWFGTVEDALLPSTTVVVASPCSQLKRSYRSASTGLRNQGLYIFRNFGLRWPTKWQIIRCNRGIDGLVGTITYRARWWGFVCEGRRAVKGAQVVRLPNLQYVANVPRTSDNERVRCRCLQLGRSTRVYNLSFHAQPPKGTYTRICLPGICSHIGLAK